MNNYEVGDFPMKNGNILVNPLENGESIEKLLVEQWESKSSRGFSHEQVVKHGD